MSQAKRKSPAKRTIAQPRSFHGIGMLIIGMIIGSMATILWQGTRQADGGVGTGIRQMIEQSKQSDQAESVNPTVTNEEQQTQQQTNFDFYTVLPEIEVVVPQDEPESSATDSNSSATQENNAEPESLPQQSSDGSAYMLQAGSYQKKAEADRLKAELALKGHSSTIQKVTIQGRGDFYRVRLGPYASHEQMVEVDNNLVSEGIKALRLKISKGG